MSHNRNIKILIEDETGRASNIHGRNVNCIHRFRRETTKEETSWLS
jgi:hypothetical protein